MSHMLTATLLRHAGIAVLFSAGAWAQAPRPDKVITEANCTAEKLGASIPATAIGEPVSAVTLSAPVWNSEANGNPAYCSVDGSMAPIDTASTARPIRFRVALPATWTHRAAQLGGGGMNGIVPNLLGNPGARDQKSPIQRGFATYGSDSGHQMAGFGGGRGPGGPPLGRGPGAPGAPGVSGGPFGRGPGPGAGFGPPPSGPQPGDDWTLNDEAMRNLGYMQMKKTHDAAMVLIERMYGERPRYNYYFGASQGGREALTVIQRYPADYDGITADVPIVNFSSLMLGPELIRIQEKPAANWVTPAKVAAIRAEFLRQCDKLDGLADGLINNYMACRAIFDVKEGKPGRHPWAEKRCPNNVDPNPGDTSAAACFTDGQISTLEMTYSPYMFATPLANGVKAFGMWTPGTDPSGSGLILGQRFRGQEGAAPDAPMHSHLGVLGVTGFLFQNLSANPLDYVEGGPLNKRRIQISEYLDGANPDLSAFNKRGGKAIVTIGTTDTLASPGSQLLYYQSVLDKMSRATVDKFARFFVLPGTNHGLGGNSAAIDGDGKTTQPFAIPNTYDKLGLIIDWVENNKAPGKTVTVTAGQRSLPMCSYPEYPKYTTGPDTAAASYTCTAP